MTGLLSNLKTPAPPAKSLYQQRHQKFLNTIMRTPNPVLREQLKELACRPDTEEQLKIIFAYSPFLSALAIQHAQTLCHFYEHSPEEAIKAIYEPVKETTPHNRQAFMRDLRRKRGQAALTIALADLGGMWSIEKVCEELSRFADFATSQAADMLLREAFNKGELSAPEEGELPKGMIVLAMGKHGAGELNYSSDTDLIILYDEEKLDYRGRETKMGFAVRFAKNLCYVLEQKMPEGYVLRTDLRLRPHLPGHPLSLSTKAAELYFERHGQNWERAAFIKARAVAADIEAGERFLGDIAPFIWRRNLDFAAIRDIHSIKRQINAHRGFAEIGVAGHDIKVGRGGIREIEFFAQTQQLILGGRHPELRLQQTVKTLVALAEGRWISADASGELSTCYRFLRQLEHRLQMIEDQQTQQLPQRADRLEQFAMFAGFENGACFHDNLRNTLKTVERHYAALFESEPDLGGGKTLVFTGTDHDQATIETLRQIGFKQPELVSDRIKAWHFGHIRATRSTRARELLTEMTPALLDVISRQKKLDRAFELFDQFLSSLPSGVQFFSLIRAHPRLLTLLCDMMGAAPKLARHLGQHSGLFDSMLAADFFEQVPDRSQLREELLRRLEDAKSLEDVLDLTRDWAHGRQFQFGMHILMGVSPAMEISQSLTQMAELIVELLLGHARTWLQSQHGTIVNSRFAILGFGKLGSSELTIGSDLDLVFVYDAPADRVSGSAKPLRSDSYFARLSKRFVSALSVNTASGHLYEIDTRLRPSGNAGPVACSISNFRQYQEKTAATWEKQALSRARPVAGDQDLCQELELDIRRALALPYDHQKLKKDVRDMRFRIFKEHGSEDIWNLKHVRGGIVEIEFIAQLLTLSSIAKHPDLRVHGTVQLFQKARANLLLSDEQCDSLCEAFQLQFALQAILRFSETKSLEKEKAPPGLLEALVRAANKQLVLNLPVSAFAALEEHLSEVQLKVRDIFDELCSDTE